MEVEIVKTQESLGLVETCREGCPKRKAIGCLIGKIRECSATAHVLNARDSINRNSAFENAKKSLSKENPRVNTDELLVSKLKVTPKAVNPREIAKKAQSVVNGLSRGAPHGKVISGNKSQDNHKPIRHPLRVQEKIERQPRLQSGIVPQPLTWEKLQNIYSSGNLIKYGDLHPYGSRRTATTKKQEKRAVSVKKLNEQNNNRRFLKKHSNEPSFLDSIRGRSIMRDTKAKESGVYSGKLPPKEKKFIEGF